MTVTTGLPQGSPISQVLFAIYVTGIHGVVESQVEDSRGIIFVDDVTWVVESTSLDDVVSKLEQCVAASLRQHGALRNVKNRSGPLLREEEPPPLQQRDPSGRPDGPLRPGATRWLRLWLDTTLALAENRRRRIGKIRQAEAKLRRIVNQYGVSPAVARNRPAGNRAGRHAVHIKAHLEQRKGGRGGAPEGHQMHGHVHTGRL